MEDGNAARITLRASREAADPSPSARRRATVIFLMFLLMVLSALQSGCDLFMETVPKGKAGAVSVMTQNLYVGDDISAVLTADPATVPFVVAQLFANVQETNFEERARAIVDEIEAAKPDLIGLQEVALFRTQSQSDFVTGTTTPNAVDVAQDFLAILMDELTKRNLNYRVVNETENADIELPATSDGVNFFDVRLTDRDVILAARHVRVDMSTSQHFAVNLPLPFGAPTDPVFLLRGFGTVSARVRGVDFTLVNTHLETAAFPEIQEAQAAELLGELADLGGPVVLLGDFNTAAPGAATGDMDTETYGMLDASYTDAFATVNPGEAGYTCCHAADLSNPTSLLAWRIDHIWHGDAVETVLAKRLGADPDDRTSSGLWPSDHAGVAALVRIDRHAN